MNEQKKWGILEISSLIVKIVLCILLIFNTFVYIYYGVMDRKNNIEQEPLRYIESWEVTDGEGNTFTTGRTYNTEDALQMKYILTSALPEDIKDHEFMYFDTRKDAAVYINGELRKDFIADRDVKVPGGSIKKFYLRVPLYPSDSGAEIKIVTQAPFKDEQVVPPTFISTRFGAFSLLIRNDGLSFLLASIVLAFSGVVLIVSIVLRFCYKLKIDMMYGALGILIIALWIITDSNLFPLIFGVYHVNGIMNYMLCLMIAFAPTLYLNSVQRGRYRKSMSVMMIVSSVNAAVWTMLHFAGIIHFYNVRTPVNCILVIMALYGIAIMILDAIKGNVRKYKYTFIGFFGFLIFCLTELIFLLLPTYYESAVPMVAGLGFLLVFVVIQQVDDLRKINLEKQHAIDISEAKTRFLASMSHEIRTPINAILGMNEMILRENSDRVIGEYSRSIKTSGKMLLMLVNDVLDFSKIEAGKLEISETSFRTSEMLRDVISLIRERADEKQLELKTEITGEVPGGLISDEFRIRQVLVNLLNNAVKYTDKGSVTLCIGGHYSEEWYELSMQVKDTGKGIRKEDQASLFEAFSRVDMKSNVNIEGTGLGLAIVKSIVESMRGEIGVESEYGVGSVFWVKLPVKYTDKQPLNSNFMEEHPGNDIAPETESFRAPEAKILAVDDNQSNLTIVKLFLKRTGIVPDLCNSGNRAAELCREKKYDLILLDHMMPAPDGIETLHIIRNDEASLNRDTKVVVLTANAVAGSRQMYLDEGFDDYLTKPLDSKLLEQTVKNMIPEEKILEPSKVADPKAGQDHDILGAGIANEIFDAHVVKGTTQGSMGATQGAGIEGLQSNVNSEQADEENPRHEKKASIRERLTAIDGLDYNTALLYCGNDEEFLEEITADIAAGCTERIERMKKSLSEKDLKSYQIEAHTIKSNMATLGLKAFSERAKQHEFAAKEQNADFITQDAEDFIRAYIEICRQLEG